MIYWHDIEQNTDEWLELRTARITSSNANILYMAKSTKGYNGLIKTLAYEMVTGKEIPDKWQGDANTERGHQMENLGRMAYEESTLHTVHNGGFYQYGEWLGASPDGNIPDGLIEIKSRGVIPFNDFQDNRKVSRPEYLQCMFHLLCSGKSFVDLVYTPASPEYTPIITRLNRDDVTIQNLYDEAMEVVKKAKSRVIWQYEKGYLEDTDETRDLVKSFRESQN